MHSKLERRVFSISSVISSVVAGLARRGEALGTSDSQVNLKAAKLFADTGIKVFDNP